MDKTKMARDVFNKYASDYERRFMDLPLYQPSFEAFCKCLPKHGATVLDIACGPGNITRYLLNDRPDLNILGIDIASAMLELARNNNPQAVFQLLDARDIRTLGKQYDGIMCGFCLPYLSKEESLGLISDAAQLLSPGGVLYLSTMEDDYSKSGLKGTSKNPEDKTYTHYHEATYLLQALRENGLTTLDIQRIDFTNPDGTHAIDLILLARK
jgi:ubiquinone/menaquinone biosynthesis C-methylase UbiE